LLQPGTDWPRRRILEVGIGATNSSAYEAAARGATAAVAFEPFVALDPSLDAALLANARNATPFRRHHQRQGPARDNTRTIADDSIDLVLSNSVLEHVADMDALTRTFDASWRRAARCCTSSTTATISSVIRIIISSGPTPCGIDG